MKIDYRHNYICAVADEGMVFTQFKDGMDILDYSSCRKLYCPTGTTLEQYREIDEKTDAEYRNMQEEAASKLS